ncbi:MAG: PVC-type heme-binding CxxCH protein [Rhodothermales bacterium]
MKNYFIAVIASCFLLAACTEEINEFGLIANDGGASLSDEQKRMPDNAVAGLAVAPGLEVSLFAAEPMLVNPTNIDIDSKGRVWVCEGINYRPHLNPQNPEREEMERIVILEDTDGDGKADSRTVFYEGDDIDAALGIWIIDGNQAIVSASPHVILLTDSDGDDKADKKEILFSGIEGVQHDHAVHAFVFGPDGRFYFNFGNAGGQLLDKDGNVVIDKFGAPIVADRNPYQEGMVFRMNPDGSDVEVLGHNFRNNYEVAVDSYGTLWQSDNDDDGNRAVRINFVMEYGNYGFRDEVTGENWRTRRTGMHEEIPKRHWHLNDPGVVPNLLQTGAGSPTGILIYEGRLLPEVFWDQMIHTDAGPNVVRAYPVEKDGAGYSANTVNILKGTSDQWFRPSDVAVAPDGSLIVADWYDPGVGGHHVGDLQKGRLFRIAPPGTPYKIPAIDLSTAEGAVEALQSPNLSQRQDGWKALHTMGASAESALLSMWSSSNDRMRARALWLLAEIDGQTRRYIDTALQDPNEDIRIAGLRIARKHNVGLEEILPTLANDESLQVRREVAVALRYFESENAPEIWTRLATQYDGADRWYLEALGIGATGKWDAAFANWKSHNQEDYTTPAASNIIWRSRAAEALPMLTSLVTDSRTSVEDRLRYFRAFDFHADSPEKSEQLSVLLNANHADQQNISVLALKHLVDGRNGGNADVVAELNTILDEVNGTRSYLDLISRFRPEDRGSELFAMTRLSDEDLSKDAASLLLEIEGSGRFMEAISAAESEESASAIITALGNVGSNDSRNTLKEVLLNESMPQDVRRAALANYAVGWSGEYGLLNMLKEQTLPPAFNEQAASILFNSSNEPRRTLAAQYLDPPAGLDGNPLPPIDELVALVGDADAGKAMFTQQCSACHIVKGQGVDFGPDLSEIGGKLPKEALYNAILYPSAGVGFGYEGYVLTLKSGGAAAGYILSRSDEEIQLREQGGQTRSYVLDDVASIEEMDSSLMPPVGRTMSGQQLADLVAYLGTLQSL